MLIYFKNKDGNITEINVEPKETIEQLVNKFQGVEKVRLTMDHYSWNSGNDWTDVLLKDISKEISVTVDSNNSS